jgi:hypothetical protein
VRRPQKGSAREATPLADPAEPTTPALVGELRRMTSVGTAQYEVDGRAFWTDDELLGLIGRNVSRRLLQAEIDLIPTVVEGGILYVNGRAPVAGTLDITSASVTAWNGVALSGTFTLHEDGRIEFTDNQVSALPVISGLCYDLNAAAATVCTEWASALKLGYDIASGDSKLPRSQRHAMLLEQADTFRSRAVVGSAQMVRSDVRRGRGEGSHARAARRAFRRLGNPG